MRAWLCGQPFATASRGLGADALCHCSALSVMKAIYLRLGVAARLTLDRRKAAAET
ncbi:hypothetical protein [Tabrizicola sp.]|jgi:hypothetical protein|uniref:hypothetical protein n=1 Tax=Tabrizicola sp. TaxID=2005166 RepID=UPI0025DAB9FC|nr:hypothetical protein [Tabrizicola sp.]